MRALFLSILLLIPQIVSADYFTVEKVTPAGTVLTENDILTNLGTSPLAISDLGSIIGYETKTTLYPNRPILAAHLSTPTMIARNQTLPLVFSNDGLEIRLEGRSLARAAAGDVIRVMNTSSNKIISVTIGEDGIGYATP